jgi:hypothetical protein
MQAEVTGAAVDMLAPQADGRKRARAAADEEDEDDDAAYFR